MWCRFIRFLLFFPRRFNATRLITGDEAFCSRQENQGGDLHVQCFVHKIFTSSSLSNKNKNVTDLTKEGFVTSTVQSEDKRNLSYMIDMDEDAEEEV